jgi:hypothetical protein
MRKLTILAVGALALGLPFLAMAADLPAYGTKNFTPAVGTPSYLSRENGSPPVGSAERAAVESDEVSDVASGPTLSRTHSSARTTRSHRGKSAVAGRSSKHHTAARSQGRTTHAAAKRKTGGRTATASSHKSASPTRTAKSSSAAGKAKTAKPGRSRVHHVDHPPRKSSRMAAAKSG